MFFLRFNFVFSFLLYSLISFGQSQLTVECSHDSILLGNSVKVEYRINNLKGDLVAPNFENCKISGPSVSSQYQNINGEESSKKTYTYVLVPLEEGILKIPAAEFQSALETIRSEEIEIKVNPNPEGIIEELPNGNGFFQEWSVDSKPKEEKGIAPKKSKRKRRKI